MTLTSYPRTSALGRRGYRGILAVAIAFAAVFLAPAAGAQLDDGNSVETCIGCHAEGGFVPVADVNDPNDAHYVDLDPAGPATGSGYRQLQIDIDSVDVSGQNVVIDFDISDENATAVNNIFASDGRFTLVQLVMGASFGDPSQWLSLLESTGFSERFTTTGGVFEALGGGSYRYTSVFDPSTAPIVANGTYRLAIQISASDLPAGNGWCDFDASVSAPNACDGPVSLTRDIVQTSVCNSCHGVTSDTKLAFHGGGRTEVEYCVTCHVVALGDADFPVMVHKIHYGSSLTNPPEGYEDISFTKDIDDCTTCHTGGGADEGNWGSVPNIDACGSCHDDVNFATGENHAGGPQASNLFCVNCHPATGTLTPGQFPTDVVHQGMLRSDEGALYRGGINGFSLDNVSYDSGTAQVTVDYSVTRAGAKMDLTGPEWTNGGSLAIKLAWSVEEYTNEDGGNTPAQPPSFNGLDVGGTVTDLGGGNYRTVIDVPSGAFGTMNVSMEGHPQADLLADGNYSRIPVADVFTDVPLTPRGEPVTRRNIVDIAKCNACHDTGGAGLTLHGSNRSSNINHCASCHNPDATDINQRPADPMDAVDGKKEEAIDFKRMIHQIHAGQDLQNGIVIYGFNGSVNDFSNVDFIGNNGNCLTCHEDGTYSTDKAWRTLPSTIDTGADVATPSDDLNISQVSAACSSCHDDDLATHHMLLNGASFMALDDNIAHPGLPDAIPVPEPGWIGLVAGFGWLGVLHRDRRRRLHRGVCSNPT